MLRPLLPALAAAALLAAGPASGQVFCRNDASCRDGDSCNGRETCRKVTGPVGVCVPGVPVLCGGPAGACRPATACDPRSGRCVRVPGDAPGTCDDGDACTVGDECVNGACIPGRPIVCRPVDACHLAGRCDHATGTCANPARADGTRCDDGDACTGDDRCVGGACRGDVARDCDDGLACTDDRCERDACTHVPVDARCTAADACTSPVCWPDFPGADADGCVAGAPAPDGGPCAPDDDPCTEDRCGQGVCGHPNVAEREACVPVTASWRRALALAEAIGALDRTLTAQAAGAADDPGFGGAVAAELAAMQDTLGVVVRTLDGRAPDAPAGVTVAERRARAAVPLVRGLAPRVRAALAAVRDAGRTGAVPPARVADALARIRGLRAGLRALRRDLRALRWVVQHFAH